ncbi:MAG: hypothetical protein HY746_08040, partial [Elusimicrobia bacterium]|nr:hypothetical protein [Elusimicrobiota bacterium]
GAGRVAADVLTNNEIKLNGRAAVYGDVYGKTVELDGQSAVYGNVYYETLKTGGKSEITGEKIQKHITVNPYPIELGSIAEHAARDNDNNKIPLTEKGKQAIDKDLRFKIDDKDSITLSTGVYYFKKMEINGKSKVKINGNVNIFCEGEVKIDGKSGFNASGNAYDSIIFADKEKGGDGKIQVDGESEIKAVVYAPDSEIEINGKSKAVGHYFGRQGKIDGEGTLQTPDKRIPAAPIKEEDDNLNKIKIKEEDGIIKVEVFTFNAVEINIYNEDGNKLDYARFSAPKDIKGTFEYSYKIKEDIDAEYVCEIRVLGVWDKLVRTKKFEECKTINIKFIQ